MTDGALRLKTTIGRARFPRSQGIVEDEARCAIGAQNVIAVSHFEENVGMIMRRQGADALELATPDHDF